MGELKGFLYICDCDSTFFFDVTVWVMNEYGIGESWAKAYNIDNTAVSSLGYPDLFWDYGLCWPVIHFEDCAALWYSIWIKEDLLGLDLLT